MAVTINGTTGIAGVDGSASTPAVQGTDTNTGIFFPAADTIAFGEGGAEAMRIDSGGRLLVGLTSANTSGANFQVSSGITFPATQSASTDANTLDDYEEGEWTPTYVTGGGSVSYGTRNGNYIKIGKFVYCRFEIITTGTTSPTGSLSLGGLPFTSNNSRYPGSVSLGYSASWNANLNPVGGYVLQNATTANLCTYALATGMAEIDSTALASGSSKNYIIGSVFYVASA